MPITISKVKKAYPYDEGGGEYWNHQMARGFYAVCNEEKKA